MNITNPMMDYYSGEESATTITSLNLTQPLTESQPEPQQNQNKLSQVISQSFQLLNNSSFFLAMGNSTIIEQFLLDNQWILFTIPGIIVICVIGGIILCCFKNKL
jgi:hypothetical protein